MTRTVALLIAAAGALAGGWLGVGYLEQTRQCDAMVELGVQCRLNQAYLPFASSIVLGMVAALCGARLIQRGAARLTRPPERPPARRSAVEVDDPYLRSASWGVAPRIATARARDARPRPVRRTARGIRSRR